VTTAKANQLQVAAPAATGNAGARFEGNVGAFYLLGLLSSGEPRGLPGATIQRVQFQQAAAGKPLDDIVVHAANADGSPATLELQAKRTLDFTASDTGFGDVVRRMAQAAQQCEFLTTRYELAVALSRSSARIERACQEVLHWARQLRDGASFVAHMNLDGFSSKPMRDFVAAFRKHLADAGAPTDEEFVWRLLGRFQILVFDFEAPGSDYEHRAHERARMVLAPDNAGRAAELWPVLMAEAQTLATAAGTMDHAALVASLQTKHGFRFGAPANLRRTHALLAEAASDALDDIGDQVGGVRLARTQLVEQAHTALDRSRIIQIAGEGGVGKSAILKHLAERLAPEGTIIVLAPGRIIPGGWLQMQHAIECPFGRDELFNELGCGGSATLFVDNVDQIEDPAILATVKDLLRAVAANPGWRAVVTTRAGASDWEANLLSGFGETDIAVLPVGEITDAETGLLAESNLALAVLLNSAHPARGIARNLFYLSRMIELGVGEDQPRLGIATEIDLGRCWWRYGGGRSETGKLARLKVLRALGGQVLASPSRVSFRADAFDPTILDELLRFDTLREDRPGSTVALRHDVLRDWTIGFLLDEEAERLTSLPLDKPLPAGLSRGLEIAARLAIEGDATGARWRALLAALEQNGGHGTWQRPVLLSLPRSEQAFALFERLEGFLLEQDGRRLAELIRLMISVETESIAARVARLQPQFVLPAAAVGFVVPNSLGWTWLVLWVMARITAMPSALIPDLSKLFQTWLMAAQAQGIPLNAQIVEVVFSWLVRIEDAMRPVIVRDIRDAKEPDLNFPHWREVRDELRMSFLSFCYLNPPLAERYLASLDPYRERHHETLGILRAPGALVRAAPRAFTDFALAALIEKEDPDDIYGRRRERSGSFGIHDHHFSPRSPSQGPFLELLEQAPAEALRLVRGVVEHATEWRREQYAEAHRPFPAMEIPFPDGAKTFEGDFEIYHWARGGGVSSIAASALMALEAWAHDQVEAGRPVDDVLRDVLGPSGSSVAFVSVAVDLVLSHWPQASEVAWPLVATPELLCFDDARHTRDVTGVDRFELFEKEPDHWRVKRRDLAARPSRRDRLSDTIGLYVFRHCARLPQLRTALEAACARVAQMTDEGDPINGLRGTAARALRMTDPQHWPLTKIQRANGSEIEVHQFKRDPQEEARLTTERERVNAEARHSTTRWTIQQALFKPDTSTPKIVLEAIRWAKAQPNLVEPQSDEDAWNEEAFDRQWDRRAVVMAAALAARDYEASDRAEVMRWAKPVLRDGVTKAGREYRGNDQIEYNAAAIAAVGFVEVYMRGQDTASRDTLLELAAHSHPAVHHAIGTRFDELSKINPRLLQALIRMTMASAIHPRRADSAEQNELQQQAYQEHIAAGVAAEKEWLSGSATEPSWPDLPAWLSRRRHRLRIGGWDAADEEEEERVIPELYADEHALGNLVGHLVPLTVGPLPEWLVPFTVTLLAWTSEANGPHGEDDGDRDNVPYTWNSHFFDFLGILSVAMPHEQLAGLFIGPITQLRDEAFHDAAAGFLRGFDQATIATDARDPENPSAVRAEFAERIRRSRGFKRLASREKSLTAEVHLADALTAIFYQPARWSRQVRPHLPEKWNGFLGSMPILTTLVTEAPGSGYVACLFLNLIEALPSPALLPFTADAMSAWCVAYGPDAHFWIEVGIGNRLCAWLSEVLNDPEAPSVLPDVCEELVKCLDVMIRAGVAQGRAVEDRLVGTAPAKNSA